MDAGTILGHEPGKVIAKINGMRIVMGYSCLPYGEAPQNFHVGQEVACEYIDFHSGACWVIREKRGDK